MTAATLARQGRGLGFLLRMNRDRLLYAGVVVLALWTGSLLGRFLLG
ncbi:MAG: hypothetical protein IT542_02115 [Rubellimicrobium sp.]|nr:hypothetical protein [Rubellimicrobium sp.]